MVVGAPCAVVELVETCVVPVLTDESLVGTEFLEVPELAGVYTGAAVVDGDVGVVVYTGDSQSGINLGEVIVILQTVGKVGALAWVLRSDVAPTQDVAPTANAAQARTVYFILFSFMIL